MNLFKKVSVGNYVDTILDACLDTAVAVPEEIEEHDKIDKYNKENDMEMNYVWLGMWMYDNWIKFDKEIDKYAKKHNTHSRDASHRLLTAYYKEWESLKAMQSTPK